MLIKTTLAENKIRVRIAELQEFRRNGCITLEQGLKYERDKLSRVNLPYTWTMTDYSTSQYVTVLNSSHQHYPPATLVQCNDLPPQQA